VKFSYDSNLRLRLWPLERARIIIRATAAMADVFLPSPEDITTLSGESDPERAMQWCLDAGAKSVALKLGGMGVLCHSEEGSFRLDAHRVQVVDATGAGDCFAGSFLARLSAGASFRSAVEYANAAAAITTTRFGAVAPIPERAQVEAFLRAITKESQHAD
jgi:2-dehydro-3-deoxygluconokinase